MLCLPKLLLPAATWKAAGLSYLLGFEARIDHRMTGHSVSGPLASAVLALAYCFVTALASGEASFGTTLIDWRSPALLKVWGCVQQSNSSGLSMLRLAESPALSSPAGSTLQENQRTTDTLSLQPTLVRLPELPLQQGCSRSLFGVKHSRSCTCT